MVKGEIIYEDFVLTVIEQPAGGYQVELTPAAGGRQIGPAKDALAKLAELADLGHVEVVVRDLLGKVIDPSVLETEADAR
jgi:hypothetical protein